MRSVDADVPLEDVRTLEEQVHVSIRSDELVTRLAAAFATLATVLDAWSWRMGWHAVGVRSESAWRWARRQAESSS
jgi:hypothetical protein